MKFKYLGEVARPGLVASYGPTLRLAVPKKDGSRTVINAPTPSGFPIGGVIDYDFTDDFSIYFLSHDPRFRAA